MIKFPKTNPLYILILLSVTLAVFRAWTPSIIISDELFIEDIAYGMAHGNSLVIPNMNGETILTKPPFLYWITAPLYKFLPVVPITRRIPMIGFGIGLIILTYLLGKKMYGQKAGTWSALLLVTSAPFVYFTKTAYFDLPNAFFPVLSIYLYVIAKEKKLLKYYLFCGLTMTLAFLNRSLLILFLPVMFVLDIIFLSKTKPDKKSLLVLFLLPVLLILPWHILAYIQAPYEFLHQYVYYAFQHHLTGNIPGDQTASPFYYLVIFIFFPPAIFSLWYLLKDKPFVQSQDKRPKTFFLFLWIILFLVPLQIARSKYPWYLMPLYPVLSILAGAFIINILPRLKPLRQNLIRGVLLVCLITGPLLLFLPIPESENIRVAKLYKDKYTDGRLYVLDYPLVPITRFFLKGAQVVPSANLSIVMADKHIYVLGRPESFNRTPEPSTIIYKSSTLEFARYEELNLPAM